MESDLCSRIKAAAKTVITTTAKVLSFFILTTLIASMVLVRPMVSADVNISITSMLEDIENTVVKQEVLYNVKKKILAAVNKLPDKEPFLKEINAIGKDLGVQPSLLLVKFYIESRIDPTQRNEDTNASGIFQLMPIGMPDGMTPSQFRKLTATQQLKYYREYITPYKKHLKDAEIEDLYLLGLYPKAVVSNPKPEIIFQSPSKFYTQNNGLDYNKDGKITRRDIRRTIVQYLEEPAV